MLVNAPVQALNCGGHMANCAQNLTIHAKTGGLFTLLRLPRRFAGATERVGSGFFDNSDNRSLAGFGRSTCKRPDAPRFVALELGRHTSTWSNCLCRCEPFFRARARTFQGKGHMSIVSCNSAAFGRAQKPHSRLNQGPDCLCGKGDSRGLEGCRCERSHPSCDGLHAMGEGGVS